MKIVLRVAGPLFIAVGLFWFAQGTGLLPWPHNSATVDYGAGVAAVGIGPCLVRMAVSARAHLGVMPCIRSSRTLIQSRSPS